jgi:hypothetical protein
MCISRSPARVYGNPDLALWGSMTRALAGQAVWQSPRRGIPGLGVIIPEFYALYTSTAGGNPYSAVSFQHVGWRETAEGSKVTITRGRTYSLSGALSNGQIIVDSGDKKTVRLILNRADIRCSWSAPIRVENVKKTIIVLAEGTDNYVADGRLSAAGDPQAEEPNAVIFSRDDLTLCGTGRLTIYGNVNDGIQGKDYLVVRGGTITVNGNITINGGSNVSAGGDMMGGPGGMPGGTPGPTPPGGGYAPRAVGDSYWLYIHGGYLVDVAEGRPGTPRASI